MTRLLMAALILFLVAAGFAMMLRDVTTFPELGHRPGGTATVTIGSVHIQTSLATTPAQWERGLSGQREPVKPMLFVFDRENDWGIWMKDMKAAIDVLWIGADHRVIYIETELLPSSYPRIYRAHALSRYVLEVPAGYVELYNLRVGDEVFW